MYCHLQVRVANLLGVVGTDVPIEQITKLVPPYKVRPLVVPRNNIRTNRDFEFSAWC